MTKPKSKPAKPPTLAALRKAARRVYGDKASVDVSHSMLTAYKQERWMARVTAMSTISVMRVCASAEPAARRDLMTCLKALEKSR